MKAARDAWIRLGRWGRGDERDGRRRIGIGRNEEVR
jgi:hypothetical protein